MNNLIILDERESEGCYTACIDGRCVGRASTIPLTGTVLIPHIDVDPGCRDLGIGSLLVRRVFDDARREGHTVLALCPFARRWADWHPAYRDIGRVPRIGELTAVAPLIAADRALRLVHRPPNRRGYCAGGEPGQRPGLRHPERGEAAAGTVSGPGTVRPRRHRGHVPASSGSATTGG